MAAFKLYYFPLRGRAELTRLLFAASGEKFQDVRIPKSEWPGKKKSFPNGTLPMLEVNGQRLTHSIAIAKYVARTFDLSGKTDMERGFVDQIVFTGNDLLEKYIQYYVQQDLQQKEKMLKLLIDDYAPNILETFDNWLRDNDGGDGYFVGSSLTLADLAIYEDVTSVLFQDKTILEKHPKLMAHRNRIEETPKIKEYLEKRQWTDI